MKHHYFTTMLMLLCGIVVQAQTDDYQPLVREGVKWVNQSQLIYYGDEPFFGPIETEVLQFSGDKDITTQSGTHTYKIVQGAYGVFMRESDKKVYLFDRTEMSDEFVLYDFSKPDTAIYNDGYGFVDYFVLCDMVEIEGKQCRVFKSSKQNTSYLVESIGLVSKVYGDLIHTSMIPYAGGGDHYYCHLDHVEDLEGNIIYKAPWYEEPANCKPLVREGVVWHYAYEDFELDEETYMPIDSTYRIIDQKMEFRGDTTIHGIEYKKCYLYETDQLAPDEPPFVLAREHNGKVIFAPTHFDETANWDDGNFYHPEGTLPGPYAEILGEYITYDFYDMAGFLQELGWPTLVSTSRTVVGEDSVYCYQTNISGKYVESVGFDGTQSGYLNDPFPIRVPCICPDILGLIMLTDLDGNILYKGNYYHLGYELPNYDLNHDGVIDIADVNIMINVLLGYDVPTGNQGHDTAPTISPDEYYDITGDGHVDITDVNDIINKMLGK